MSTPNKPDPEGDAEQPPRPPTEEQMMRVYRWARDAAHLMGRRYDSKRFDAEDLVSDVMMRLLQRPDRLPAGFWDDENRGRAYVIQMLKYSMIDSMRAERRRESRAERRRESKLIDLAETSRAAELLDMPGLEANLSSALESIPSKDAELVRQRLQGLPLSQTAKILGISEASARRRYSRALQSLRSAFEGGLTAKPQPTSKPVEENPFPDPEPEREGIELYLDPGNASESEVRDVLRALNNLHKSSGGLGLEFRIDGTFVLARQEVPA